MIWYFFPTNYNLKKPLSNSPTSAILFQSLQSPYHWRRSIMHYYPLLKKFCTKNRPNYPDHAPKPSSKRDHIIHLPEPHFLLSLLPLSMGNRTYQPSLKTLQRFSPPPFIPSYVLSKRSQQNLNRLTWYLDTNEISSHS